MVRLGVENLLSGRIDLLEGERVGLATNPSGVDSKLRNSIDLLHGHEDVDLRRLFGPEHGIRGRAQAGERVDDGADGPTGLPVSSLYGETYRPDHDDLADLDVLVYHMQDVGCRFYTYLYTLAYCMEEAAKTDTRFVVLDRPNPIAPLDPAGNRVPDEHGSFIGDYRLPVVHGLTVGELADYFNEEFDIGADLEVVELSGWDHDDWWDETDLPWLPPSPNIPTLRTATIYPGTCFFEGTTLSEGRGTTTPFEYIGAPWVDAQDWAGILNDYPLEGVLFRPVYFTPTYKKHVDEEVEGVHIVVTDREAIDPLDVGLTMLVSAFVEYPESDWNTFDSGHAIDNHAGGPYLREAVDDFRPSATSSDTYEFVQELRADWTDELSEYVAVQESYKRY
jgi:beta-N-acetylhexosaminidase